MIDCGGRNGHNSPSRRQGCVYGDVAGLVVDEAFLFVAVVVRVVIAGDDPGTAKAGGRGPGVAVGDEEEGARAGCGRRRGA